MTVARLRAAVDALAPEALAEDWDNVGLLVGRADRPVDRALVALDLRAETVREAVRRDAQAIVTHHPPIFPAAAALTDADPSTARVLEAAEAGVAVIAAHTNLDAAPGGLNDI
ncbi:MAG: Nif3-like dinuclear metal center hexameric protein, partial [Miltoncostaeaceae bacterium]